jgi:hypothetical protein
MISLPFPDKSINIFVHFEQLLHLCTTKSLLPGNIHVETVRMPITATIARWPLETVVSLILMAIAVCSSIFVQSPFYRRPWEEGAQIAGLTIFYTSGFSVIGIHTCRVVSAHPTSSGSLVCLGWGAGLGAVAAAGVRIMGLY